jgi:hypothetical protein
MTSILGQGTGPIIEALDSQMKKMGMPTEGQARHADSEWQSLQGLLHGLLHCPLSFLHSMGRCILHANPAWKHQAPQR